MIHLKHDMPKNRLIKAKIYFWWRLIEEGIAYYLTFKWALIVTACIISFFAAFSCQWFFKEYFGIFMDWGLVYFVIWSLTLIAMIYECPLPDSVKEKIYQDCKLNSDFREKK